MDGGRSTAAYPAHLGFELPPSLGVGLAKRQGVGLVAEKGAGVVLEPPLVVSLGGPAAVERGLLPAGDDDDGMVLVAVEPAQAAEVLDVDAGYGAQPCFGGLVGDEQGRPAGRHHLGEVAHLLEPV